MSLNIEKMVQGSNPENRKKENSNAYLFWGKSPLYFETSHQYVEAKQMFKDVFGSLPPHWGMTPLFFLAILYYLKRFI